jgi:hypothetical protein
MMMPPDHQCISTLPRAQFSGRSAESRTRSGHAGENLSIVRWVALCLLKRSGEKGSMETRRLRAGWDQEFLSQFLQGIPAI